MDFFNGAIRRFWGRRLEEDTRRFWEEREEEANGRLDEATRRFWEERLEEDTRRFWEERQEEANGRLDEATCRYWERRLEEDTRRFRKERREKAKKEAELAKKRAELELAKKEAELAKKEAELAKKEAELAKKFRLLEIKIEELKLFEVPCNEPKLSFRIGRAIHELKKCRGQIFREFFEGPFKCKVDEEIDILEVGLWDSHRFTPDTLVGSAKVQLDNVTYENFHHFTTPLFSDDGRVVGEVQLKIRLVEASMQHSITPLLPPVGLTGPSVLPDGLPDLRVTEIPSARIRARIGDLYEFNLEGCNTPLKDIDPYISMKYGDVVYKTETSKDGVALMEFLDRFVCKADETNKVLDIDLWKRHRIIPDELVGSAKIELDSVTSGAFRHIPTQLFSKDGRYVGEVGLKVRRIKPSDVNHPLKSYKRGNFFNCTKQ